MPLTSVSNKVDGVAGWDKSVTDVNNVDESFANARDLGYSRLNNTRISVIGRLGKYDSKDLYSVQVQSNGKLFINLRTGDSTDDDSVLDLSEHEQRLNEIKAELAAMGVKTEEETVVDTTPKTPLEKARAAVAEQKAAREKANAGLLDDIAPGMTIKVYMTKGKKTSIIGDSTASKTSAEYTTMKEILSGEYKAKKGTYYIEISTEESLKEEEPYVLQIKQGSKYVNDYLVTEAYSDDSKNETISLTSSTSSSEQISSAYAMQIQAQKYEATTTMLSDAYSNLSSIKNKSTGAAKLFSSLINTSA
jgi:hypothetical protein